MTSSQYIIEMATRRVQEGSGSYHPTPNDTQWQQSTPDLKTIFSNISFVIIGGLATRMYMPERMTMDINILIHSDDTNAAKECLHSHGATRIGTLPIGGETWRLRGGKQIDLIHSHAPWLSEALSHPRIGPDGQPYIQLPWLILLKLTASRTQDLADCSRMLGAADPATLDQVLNAIRTHQPADIDDVLSLIKLGQLENGNRNITEL